MDTNGKFDKALDRLCNYDAYYGNIDDEKQKQISVKLKNNNILNENENKDDIKLDIWVPMPTTIQQNAESLVVIIVIMNHAMYMIIGIMLKLLVYILVVN